MKYWLLTTEYPPFFGGGISTYCFHTAAMLAGKGYDVSVFVNDAAVDSIEITEQENIRIIRFNPSQTNSSSFLGHNTNISYEFAHIIKQFVEKEGKPDIIEAQEYLGIAYYLLQYKLMLYEWCKDVPVLITMHSPSLLYMEYNHVSQFRYPNFWVCEMERFCLRAADHIISPSSYIIAELGQRYKLTNEKITVVPNPYVSKENDHQPEDGQADEIVFYGKLTAQKGIFQLLTYFKQLWDQGFNRPLYLLGGIDIVYHPEGLSMGNIVKKKYGAYIQKGLLKIEDKILPGAVATRLARAELIIIPSNNDNLPYVVFEMMGLGKIVLVSKQGGQSEVVQDVVNGFVFDHTEPETFSLQLRRILQLTPEERRSVSERAVKTVANKYSYEAVYKQKKPVLDNLVAERNIRKRQFPFVRPHNSLQLNFSKAKEVTGKLSIVVPYFNMGKYIDETIESITKAGYSNKEIIIINDGSSDEVSIAKLEQYRHTPGIRIIDTVNKGLASARNLGARECTGEFLAFLDADDTVHHDYYSRAITVLNQYENVHFAGCWTQYFDQSVRKWPGFLPEPPLILYHNLVNSSALVYKRDGFLAAGLNDTNMVFPGLEDYESVIAMTANGYSGVVIPELLFNYRVRNDSMIRAISKNKKLYLYQHISQKHKKFYSDYAVEVFNLSTANGSGILFDNPTLDLHLADNIPFGGKVSLKLIRLIKKNRHARKAAYKLYSYIKK